MKLISTELGQYFINLGLLYPTVMLYIIAIIEILCGILLVLNNNVKYATLPLIIIMIAALLLTKVPLLHSGLLHFAFNARLDIVMLVMLFILLSRKTHYE